MDAFEKLKEAKSLLDEGIINAEEFQRLKDRFINEMDFKQPALEKPSECVVSNSANTNSNVSVSEKNGEEASTTIKILSFLIPIIGIIFFFTEKNNNKEAADDVLRWAGIGFLIGMVGYLLFIFLMYESSPYY